VRLGGLQSVRHDRSISSLSGFSRIPQKGSRRLLSWRVLPTATTIDNTSDAAPTQYQASMCTAPYPSERNKS
jgi:hypothetical protein